MIRALRRTLAELGAYGFTGEVFVGGSFVTSKADPRDVDIMLDCSSMASSTWPCFARFVLAERERWDEAGVDLRCEE